MMIMRERASWCYKPRILLPRILYSVIATIEYAIASIKIFLHALVLFAI